MHECVREISVTETFWFIIFHSNETEFLRINEALFTMFYYVFYYYTELRNF